jgi:succinate dehydrogenase hydrophobic anchor subunit
LFFGTFDYLLFCFSAVVFVWLIVFFVFLTSTKLKIDLNPALNRL